MAELNPTPRMNVLVTGATGAIGRAVARELVVNSYRVFGLVRSDEARARLPYAVIAVKGDIRDPVAWEATVHQCDAVVNLAFPDDLGPAGPKDRAAAEREADAYAAILDRLCAFMRREKKLLVHTFGALLYDPEPDGWVREVSAISSGRGFGIRHRVAWPVFAEHRRHGLKAISVNPCFVYGRGGWFEHGMLDPMSQGRSTIIGDGSQTMHYIAAADAAAAYRLAIEKGKAGEDYLIADDEPTTQGAFVRLVAKELGAPEPVCVPEAQLVPMMGDWAVEAYTTCHRTDATKAHRELGWRPRFRTIAEGVPIVVREYKRSKLAAATPR
jgi:nucleoside-diphosphate-sugar epimerase